MADSSFVMESQNRQRKTAPKDLANRQDAQRVSLDFEKTFHEYWERVCNIAYRFVGDRSEAEDLALETFLRLHQNHPETIENVGGWLYQVSSRLGLNALRARQRRERYEIEEAATGQDRNNETLPEPVFELKQEQQLVRTVLARMKPRDARLLVLRSSGHSYKEIALALNIPLTSVGKLLARAESDFLEKYKRSSGINATGSEGGN